MVICLQRYVQLFAYGPADVTAIPKLHYLLRHLNPDWLYLSGTGLTRLNWKRGRKPGVVVFLSDRLLRLFGTHCRKRAFLFSRVFLSSLFSVAHCPSACEFRTLRCYTGMFVIIFFTIIITSLVDDVAVLFSNASATPG